MADLILGIEIGGTKLQLALGTPVGELIAVHQGQVNVDQSADGIRKWLVEQVPELVASRVRGTDKVAAIGCGFGGPIDSQRGRVLKSIQISGWQDFPLRDWLEDAFGLPAWVENDSNAAAWGEYQLGFGKGTQHFFYTNIGSGVGGGFIFNRSLYDGQGFGAGEFGHTYIPDLTKKTECEPVKIENLCSGWAIENRLRQPGYIPETSDLYHRVKGNVSHVTTRELAESARTGDAFTLHEIDLVAHGLGIGLANVLSLTNVERIAIGGGVSNLGELFIDPVRQYTARYAFVSSQGRFQIQRSILGDSIVLIGAILLAKQVMT